MIRLAALAAASLCLLVASAAPAAPISETGEIPTATGGTPEMPYVPGEVLVRFDGSADAGDRTQLRSQVDGSLEDATLGVKGLQLLELEGDESPDQAADRLNAAPGVKYAHPNYIQQMYGVPNDPDFPLQWGALNSGQLIEGFAGTAGADIDADLAWNQTTGNPAFTAGIMDSGIQTDHADFAPNVVPGVDVSGPADDADPRDLNGHGSHVGGLTGAAGNNGVGTAGMTWNTKIMPVRINVDTGVPVSNQVRGFQAVKARGVRLVNGSFGGRGGEIPAQRDAIAAASDTLFVIAAGNEGTTLDGNPAYPCAYELPNVVCVGASTNQETPADFSNFSPKFVDLFAPGKDMRSVENTAVHALRPPEGDDFEDGTGQDFDVQAGNWVVGNPGLAGSGVAVTGRGNPGRIATSNISTVGMSNCALIVKVGGSSVVAGDAARIGVRAGSDTPTFLTTLTGSEGLPGDGFDFAMPLQAYEGIPNLQVVIEVTSTNFKYVFDDVRVKCNPNGVTGRSTKYISGTSQAAPVVTGVAALIFGQQPTRPISEVRAALLDSVDKRPAYAGKSVTGGRVNANSAVSAGAAILAARTPPVPSRLSLAKRSFAALRGKGPSVVPAKSASARSSAKKKKKKKAKKAAGGTVLKFTLSKPGSVAFAVSRTFTGVKKSKTSPCRETTSKKKAGSKKKAKKSAKKRKKAKAKAKAKAKKCTGTKAVGSFTIAAAAGANRVGFTGRVANKALKVGSYQLIGTGVASNGATRSTPVKTKFSIRGAAKKKSKKK